jgi:hypothetical protein
MRDIAVIWIVFYLGVVISGGLIFYIWDHIATWYKTRRQAIQPQVEVYKHKKKSTTKLSA